MELGFDDIGFSTVHRLDKLEKPFVQWLENGFHGNMAWLENNLEKRLNPKELLPGAKTMISLISWYHSNEYEPGNGISRYAVGRDYHKVLKKKGQALITYIQEEFGDIQARIFVDSAPVMEREWAKKSGLGWIGKNGCLIQPKKGSWFFIAEILLDLEIIPDQEMKLDLCGSCSKCLDACPTSALLDDGLLDARKCISYLTIELKEEMGVEFKGKWDDWIFGCDICQEVCPWNRKPLKHQFLDFTPRQEIMKVKLDLTGEYSEEEMEERINGTPLKRAGVKILKRNLDTLI